MKIGLNKLIELLEQPTSSMTQPTDIPGEGREVLMGAEGQHSDLDGGNDGGQREVRPVLVVGAHCNALHFFLLLAQR